MFTYNINYVIKGDATIISTTAKGNSELDASTRLRKRIAKQRTDINVWSDITIVGMELK